MQDISVNRPLEYYAGFNVYPGAVETRDKDGTTDPIRIVIPYDEP